MTGTLHRFVVTIAAVLTLVAVAAACTKDPEPTELPPLPSTPTPGSSSPSPSPTGTEGLTDREQVRVMNVEFLKHYREAQDVPKAERKKFLTQWMTDAAAQEMADNIEAQRKKHLRSKGHFISNVTTVTFRDGQAIIRNCVDQSKFALLDERTGKDVGGDHYDYFLAEYTLTRTDDGWRVSASKDLKRTCTPPS